MKKILLSFNFLILFSFSFFLNPVMSYGQLSGNYTINPRSSASSTNYRNWASAVGDLLSGSRSDGGSAVGPGISAAVTFTVYDSIYANTFIDVTTISGASAAKTITFRSAGGDFTRCALQNPSSTSSTDDFVLNLNGCDFVTFEEIGFERTGTNTYCTVVQITNDADNNKLISCRMKGRKMPSNSSLGFAYGIGSAIFFSGNADSTLIKDNTLLYGYNGIYCTSTCNANTITGNIIDTSGSSGIYMTGQTSLNIIGNTFNMGDFGPSTGHYTSYGMRIESSPNMLIAKNKVFMFAKNAQVVRALMVASTTSSASAPTRVYNNWVMNAGGTNDCTGLTEYGCAYVNFFYNNVLITNSLANGSAFYHYPNFSSSFIKAVNNNLINKGGGYAYNVPGTNTGDIDSVNFNNAYSNGTNLTNWGGTNYTTFSGWQGASGKDGNSINKDPGYTGNTNLHVSNISLNGKALPYSAIIDDIDNDTRDNTTPDMGADEFFPIANDAGVANLDSPLLFCAGKQMVKVKFQNYGYDTIKSIQINWQINGTTQTSYSWSGKLAPGSSSASIPLGSLTFSANTAYTFKTWTQSPNGKSDGRSINDTLKLLRYAAMAGTYSIDDTVTANYKSFNEAITDMTSRGICGAITFNVYPATYKEQITLVELPGMNASNPVKFINVGKDSTKILVTLPSSTATGTNNAVVQLRGADYVTFKGISFERTGTNTYGHVIHIINGSNNNTFTNCQILGLTLISPNANAINIWSDQGQDNNNVFRNNYIKNGNYGIIFTGVNTVRESGTVVEGNTFENGFSYAVQLAYNDAAIVKGNTFLNINTATSGNYDLQLLDCDSNIRVEGNFFKDVLTDIGVLLTGCNASKSNPGIVANNAIIKPSGKAISLDGVDNQSIVFNSISVYGSASTNAGIYTSGTTSSNIVLKNNNIVMEGGDVFYISTPSQIIGSDNNNLLPKGSGQFAYWGGSYSSLIDLVNASGFDSKSKSVDPIFKSGSDLHIKNPLLKEGGVPITNVLKDFDGETRNTVTPDIGADEFKRAANDAGMVTLIKPDATSCAGPLDVKVVIKNFGNDTLKSATIMWSVSGKVQALYNWSGKLKTNAMDTIVIGNFNFYNLFSPQFSIKSSLPNGNPDEIKFNDSITLTRTIMALPSANVGADMIICPGDSVIIGPGLGTGLGYKWTNLANKVLGTKNQIMVKPAANTKYILEVTSVAYGCVNRDTIEIFLGNKPKADAGKDQSICKGSSTKIGETAQSGMNYNWTSVPTGFTSSSANPFIAPSQTTMYIVEKSLNSTGCNAFDTVLISVVKAPTPSVQGINSTCQGSITSYNSAKNSGISYKWIVIGGQILSGQGTDIISVRWNIDGNGNVKVIETNTASCKDSNALFVTIVPKPKADFSYSGTCYGNTTAFKNLSLTAISFSWTFGDGGIAKVANPNYSYASTNSYTVTFITANNSGCQDTISKTITINPLPQAGIKLLQKSGRNVDFMDSSSIISGSIVGWNWKFGDGDTSILRNASHQYAALGSYIVRLCVTSLQGCVNCTSRNLGIAGTHNYRFDRQIYAVPNPGSGIFNIHASENVELVIVTNMVGQIIGRFEPLSDNFDIDLRDQVAGVYSLQIQTGDKLHLIRIIKN